jgi:hypothetical protein
LCGKWLAKDEDDHLIVRELPASNKDGVASLPMVNYKVSILTGDRKGAGTNANIHLTVYGKNGDCGKRIFDAGSKKFQRAQTDIVGVEVGSCNLFTDNVGYRPRRGHKDQNWTRWKRIWQQLVFGQSDNFCSFRFNLKGLTLSHDRSGMVFSLRKVVVQR